MKQKIWNAWRHQWPNELMNQQVNDSMKQSMPFYLTVSIPMRSYLDLFSLSHFWLITYGNQYVQVFPTSV